MTIFTNQEISHKYLDVWLFLKSGKIWPLCAPSLVWQQRAFPQPPTPTSSLSEETCAQLMDHLIPHHFLLLCICAHEHRTLALPIDTTCLSPEGIWFSNLYFKFCISWNFSLPFPVALNFSSFLFPISHASMSWCYCHPWQRSAAIGVFMLRAFKLFCAKIHIWHRKHCLPVCLKIKPIYT